MLLGGAGDDQLFGGSGRNLLIGGTGEDKLRSEGEDILIGSTTAYDANETAMAALLAEWSSAQSYAQRVAHLSGQTPGGLNGSFVLRTTGAGATVFDDFVRDQISTKSGQDWVLAFDSDKVK